MSDSAHSLSEWYANDFRLGSAHFVIFLNSATCVAVVVNGAPYKTVIGRFLEQLPAHFRRLGWDGTERELSPALLEGTEYLKAEDRSPLGLMVEFVKQLQYLFEDGDLDLSRPDDMGFRLARVPIVARGLFPIDAFQKLVGIHDPERVRQILRMR